VLTPERRYEYEVAESLNHVLVREQEAMIKSLMDEGLDYGAAYAEAYDSDDDGLFESVRVSGSELAALAHGGNQGRF
jgi:hypothetical protein